MIALALSLWTVLQLTPHDVSDIWLAANSPDSQDRLQAYARATQACDNETPTVCRGLIAMFADDSEPSIGWDARDRLLTIDVDAALEGASAEYKLDLLSRLAGGALLAPGAAQWVILDTLVQDPNAEIQEAASLTLTLQEAMF